MLRPLRLSAIRAVVFTVFIFTFSFFIHHPFPLQLISFSCVVVLAFLIATEQDPAGSLLGKSHHHNSTLVWSVTAMFAGFILAFIMRQNASITAMPNRLVAFTIVAVMIGIMEEVIFRGWMFSQFKGKWIWPAVIVTSFAHAGYKAILFFSPYLLYEIDKTDLFINTFEAGIFLGLTRAFSGSVWPALLAHAIFDLMVYGDQVQPWWVF